MSKKDESKGDLVHPRYFEHGGYAPNDPVKYRVKPWIFSEKKPEPDSTKKDVPSGKYPYIGSAGF